MIGERYFSALNLAKQEMCRDRHGKTDGDTPLFGSVYEFTFLRHLLGYMVSYSSCIPPNSTKREEVKENLNIIQ